MRLVLYVSRGAHEALAEDADRRTTASGLPVTLEATARVVLYRGLGLAPDGSRGEGGGAPAPGLLHDLARMRKEMLEVARSARAGELDVEYLYREIERWSDEIEGMVSR